MYQDKLKIERDRYSSGLEGNHFAIEVDKKAGKAFTKPRR